MSKKKKKNTHLRDLEEWQEHMYDPYYYTGGKVPIYLSKPAKPILYSWFIIIITALIDICMIVTVVINKSLELAILLLFTVGPLSLLQYMGAIRTRNKYLRSKRRKNNKKFK